MKNKYIVNNNAVPFVDMISDHASTDVTNTLVHDFENFSFILSKEDCEYVFKQWLYDINIKIFPTTGSAYWYSKDKYDSDMFTNITTDYFNIAPPYETSAFNIPTTISDNDNEVALIDINYIDGCTYYSGLSNLKSQLFRTFRNKSMPLENRFIFPIAENKPIRSVSNSNDETYENNTYELLCTFKEPTNINSFDLQLHGSIISSGRKSSLLTDPNVEDLVNLCTYDEREYYPDKHCYIPYAKVEIQGYDEAKGRWVSIHIEQRVRDEINNPYYNPWYYGSSEIWKTWPDITFADRQFRNTRMYKQYKMIVHTYRTNGLSYWNLNRNDNVVNIMDKHTIHAYRPWQEGMLYAYQSVMGDIKDIGYQYKLAASDSGISGETILHDFRIAEYQPHQYPEKYTENSEHNIVFQTQDTSRKGWSTGAESYGIIDEDMAFKIPERRTMTHLYYKNQIIHIGFQNDQSPYITTRSINNIDLHVWDGCGLTRNTTSGYNKNYHIDPSSNKVIKDDGIFELTLQESLPMTFPDTLKTLSIGSTVNIEENGSNIAGAEIIGRTENVLTLLCKWTEYGEDVTIQNTGNTILFHNGWYEFSVDRLIDLGSNVHEFVTYPSLNAVYDIFDAASTGNYRIDIDGVPLQHSRPNMENWDLLPHTRSIEFGSPAPMFKGFSEGLTFPKMGTCSDVDLPYDYTLTNFTVYDNMGYWYLSCGILTDSTVEVSEQELRFWSINVGDKEYYTDEASYYFDDEDGLMEFTQALDGDEDIITQALNTPFNVTFNQAGWLNTKMSFYLNRLYKWSFKYGNLITGLDIDLITYDLSNYNELNDATVLESVHLDITNIDELQSMYVTQKTSDLDKLDCYNFIFNVKTDTGLYRDLFKENLIEKLGSVQFVNNYDYNLKFPNKNSVSDEQPKKLITYESVDETESDITQEITKDVVNTVNVPINLERLYISMSNKSYGKHFGMENGYSTSEVVQPRDNSNPQDLYPKNIQTWRGLVEVVQTDGITMLQRNFMNSSQVLDLQDKITITTQKNNAYPERLDQTNALTFIWNRQNYTAGEYQSTEFVNLSALPKHPNAKYMIIKLMLKPDTSLLNRYAYSCDHLQLYKTISMKYDIHLKQTEINCNNIADVESAITTGNIAFYKIDRGVKL